MTGQLMTPIAVAEQLNVTTKVVLRLLRSGALEGSKVGRQWRVLPNAIDRYVARHRYTPGQRLSPPLPLTRRAVRMPGECELSEPGANTFLK